MKLVEGTYETFILNRNWMPTLRIKQTIHRFDSIFETSLLGETTANQKIAPKVKAQYEGDHGQEEHDHQEDDGDSGK